MLAQLKPPMLAEHVGTQFDVLDDPAHVFCLTLTAVVEQAKTERYEAFSLLFHGPASPFLQQATHKLRHSKLGELELFLVPVAKDQDGFQYEAVFNNLI